jgi:hypothetical protein
MAWRDDLLSVFRSDEPDKIPAFLLRLAADLL